MSDFLRNLLARSFGQAELVQPHLPTMFEPHRPGAGVLSQRARDREFDAEGIFDADAAAAEKPRGASAELSAPPDERKAESPGARRSTVERSRPAASERSVPVGGENVLPSDLPAPLPERPQVPASAFAAPAPPSASPQAIARGGENRSPLNLRAAPEAATPIHVEDVKQRPREGIRVDASPVEKSASAPTRLEPAATRRADAATQVVTPSRAPTGSGAVEDRAGVFTPSPESDRLGHAYVREQGQMRPAPIALTQSAHSGEGEPLPAIGAEAEPSRPHFSAPKAVLLEAEPHFSASGEGGAKPVEPPSSYPTLVSRAKNPEASLRKTFLDENLAAPDVRITIGRVEVRAVFPGPPVQRPLARPRSTLSLDDYLKQSDRGRG